MDSDKWVVNTELSVSDLDARRRVPSSLHSRPATPSAEGRNKPPHRGFFGSTPSESPPRDAAAGSSEESVSHHTYHVGLECGVLINDFRQSIHQYLLAQQNALCKISTVSCMVRLKSNLKWEDAHPLLGSRLQPHDYDPPILVPGSGFMVHGLLFFVYCLLFIVYCLLLRV